MNMENLFVVNFIIISNVANYERSVIILADSEKEAKEKVIDNFCVDKDSVRVTEILAKFKDGIFGLPLLKHVI